MTLTLSDDQAQAVRHVTNRANWRKRHYWLAGYAGTGKTSIAPFIVADMRAQKPLFVAPTNKAAKVLAGKLGMPAISIHKAIYYPPGESPDGDLTWRLNPDGPAASADLIICDEASMVGTRLGQDLASFGKPIVAIGDPGQLPPVNDTPFFCVGKPDFALSRIHRQAEGNPIIALSRDIREGKQLRPGKMGDAVTIAREGTVDVPDDLPQIIVGTHKRRWRVTNMIRDIRGLESAYPSAGEPLVIRKNSMEYPMINGQEARAVSFSKADEECVADCTIETDDGDRIKCKVWDGPFRELRYCRRLDIEQFDHDWQAQKRWEQVDFGWAITCHVSQGSQWPDVLVFDESAVFKADARRWCYTAVTRASERLTVII